MALLCNQVNLSVGPVASLTLVDKLNAHNGWVSLMGSLIF